MGKGHSSDPPSWKPKSVPDAELPWDEAKARWLIGKYVLVGITYVASDGGTVTATVQYHGTVTSADRQTGISIVCNGEAIGRTIVLPPLLDVFEVARPGNYRLRSTGEVINDPDAVAAWTLTAPLNS